MAVGWKKSVAGALALAVAAVVLMDCRPRNTGGSYQPVGPSAGDNPDGKGDSPELAVCTGVSPNAQPFIADWDNQERAQLLSAMQGGVAVVKYTCSGISVLAGCKLKGDYAYANAPLAPTDFEIEKQSDVVAALPKSGDALAPELSSGTRVKLSYATSGRRSSTRREALKSELTGSCDGATHIVRSAWLGAFKLSSSGGKGVSGAAGDVGSCNAATGPAAPAGCEVLLRLELGPVVERSTPPAVPAPGSRYLAEYAENRCSLGYVLDGGRCVRAAEAKVPLCKRGDLANCKAQCASGSAPSCHNAGLLAAAAPSDEARKEAPGFFEKACSASYAPSCGVLGALKLSGPDADAKRAESLLSGACLQGDAPACVTLARSHSRPLLSEDPEQFKPDESAAVAAFETACKLGSAYACALLAERTIEGIGVQKDREVGAAALKSGCEAGNGFACTTLGRYTEKGRGGVARDGRQAAKLYYGACLQNHPPACAALADLYLAGGRDLPKNPEKGRTYAFHGCTTIKSGGEACRALGSVHEAQKDRPKAVELYTEACEVRTDALACKLAGDSYERGKDTTLDRAKAMSLMLRGCLEGAIEDDQAKQLCRRVAPKLEQDSPQLALEATWWLCRAFDDHAACRKAKRLQEKLAPAPPAEAPAAASEAASDQEAPSE